MRQQASTNADATLKKSQGITDTATAGYNNMLTNPGYSESQKSAITGQAMGATNSAYDSLANKAQLRATRTGNSAGFNDLQDQLARDRGQQVADTSMKTQTQFGDAARQDRSTALEGLYGLGGQQNQLYGTQMGNAQNDLNTRAQLTPYRPGFWGTFGNSFAGALGNTLGGGNFNLNKQV